MKFSFAFTVLVIFTWTPSVWSARILGFFPTPTRSHLIVDMAVARGLAQRGHDLTVVTNMPLSDHNSSVKHIQLKSSKIFEEFTGYLSDTSDGNSAITFLNDALHLFPIVFRLSDEILKDPQIQMLKEKGSFDLCIFDYFMNNFQIGLAAHFKCPSVLIWTTKPLSMLEIMLGNPPEYSYVPFYYLNEVQPLNFYSRVKNTLLIGCGIVTKLVIDCIQDSYYKSHFPLDKYPPMKTVLQNISLLLVNHHFSQGCIRPKVPAVVEIGGIQIKEKPNPLPTDIETFLDNAAKDGVIYFSFGTLVKATKLKKDTMKIMFTVLSSLKQKVLWKWDNTDFPGNASNILFKDWLPQDDILAHKSVKLFITHGGNGGLTEAQYHGVPMLAIPFFGDQISNVKIMEANGFGLSLNFETLTEVNFRETLLEILENPKYENKIKKFSELYRDRPQTALETALFWIEYVIRHRGAPHMQSPRAKMTWWQILNIDVLLFLLVVTFASIKVCVTIVKLLFKITANKSKIKQQ